MEYTESNGSGILSWTKSYVYLGDSLLSTTTASGVEYAHPDALGTRLVSNAQTGTTSENINLPFGVQINNESTNTTNKRKFTSYDRNAVTGLDYAQNRTYDSKQGRFTQVDPIGISASSLMNPQSLNLYAYCGNDPINHTDSSGLFWGALKRFFSTVLKIVKIVVAVVIAVVAVLAFAAGHPEIGIRLAVASANIFAQVSGNRAFQQITKYLSIAVSAYQIYNSPPSIIISFTSGGGTNSHLLPILFAGVGVITSSFGGGGGGIPDKKTIDKILDKTVKGQSETCRQFLDKVLGALKPGATVDSVYGDIKGGISINPKMDWNKNKSAKNKETGNAIFDMNYNRVIELSPYPNAGNLGKDYSDYFYTKTIVHELLHHATGVTGQLFKHSDIVGAISRVNKAGEPGGMTDTQYIDSQIQAHCNSLGNY